MKKGTIILSEKEAERRYLLSLRSLGMGKLNEFLHEGQLYARVKIRGNLDGFTPVVMIKNTLHYTDPFFLINKNIFRTAGYVLEEKKKGIGYLKNI